MKKFSMILEELFEAKNTSRKKPAADDDDADDFKEGTKEVYAFVIYTDSKDNRFFLNKNKRAFTKFDPKDVFSVSLGQAKNAKKLTPQERMKILKQIPDQIGKIDKFEDDVAVMDQFELEGAPASWQPGNSTDESLIEAKEREIIPKALVDKALGLGLTMDDVRKFNTVDALEKKLNGIVGKSLKKDKEPSQKTISKKEFESICKAAAKDAKSDGMDIQDVGFDLADSILYDPKVKEYVKKVLGSEFNKETARQYVADTLTM